MIQQILASSSSSTPSSLSSLPSDTPDATAFQQLQSYFPFFDPSFPSVPTDTPIVRVPVSSSSATPSPPVPAAASSPSKEVARVLSSQHNVFLALLRSEHVEDDTHMLQLQPTTDANAATMEASTTPFVVVPYQPDWWQQSTDNDAASATTEGTEAAPARP
jgi:hypothetical protein